MIDPQKINQVVEQVLEAMPEGVKNLPNDIQENIKAALNSVFSKMDLVTREEFDIQVKVLEKTRMKLEAIEKKLDELA